MTEATSFPSLHPQLSDALKFTEPTLQPFAFGLERNLHLLKKSGRGGGAIDSAAEAAIFALPPSTSRPYLEAVPWLTQHERLGDRAERADGYA